ncbi:MAG: DUF2283 domain-containing protein [Desulfatirhabdiaceae bacterium]
MKFSYDPQYNIAYIRLRPKSSEVVSIKISDELIVDLSPDGTVYGIELLNANEQLMQGDNGRFLFYNEHSGQEVDVSITV